jgi:hypothetical protein
MWAAKLSPGPLRGAWVENPKVGRGCRSTGAAAPALAVSPQPVVYSELTSSERLAEQGITPKLAHEFRERT